MLLKDICTVNVACCHRNTSIHEAARLMREHHTGDLIVVDDVDARRVPAGIVTDRDIVIHVLAGERDVATTRVADIMVAQLVIGEGAEDVAVGVQRMRQHGVRRLPVVDRQGSLIGIVTLDDLFSAHARQARELASILSKEQDHEQRASL